MNKAFCLFRQGWTPKSFYAACGDDDLTDLKYMMHLHSSSDAEPRHPHRKPFGRVQDFSLSEEDAHNIDSFLTKVLRHVQIEY